MSGHRKFRELTRRFTLEDRQYIEQIKAEMRDVIDSAESSTGSGSTGAADTGDGSCPPPPADTRVWGSVLIESGDVHRQTAIDPDKP